MINGKLTVSELMEGALAIVSKKPLAVGTFLLIHLVASYCTVWIEVRYELGFAFGVFMGLAVYTLTTSPLILSIGGGWRELLADPVELLIRLIFAQATMLVVTAGAALGAILLIVPGLYIMARWAIAYPLILLGGAGIGEALSGSWQLTERSVWALVAVGLIVVIPQTLLGIFADNVVAADFLRPSAGTVFKLGIGSLAVAFQMAAFVFAYGELATKADSLEEVFA